MRNGFRVSAVLAVLAVAVPVSAMDYSSPYGEWRGEARFHARIDSTFDRAAAAVTDLKLSVDRHGRIVGVSPGNGCKASGRLSPGRTERLFELDVTLSGCRYAGLNRRYGGRLTLKPNKTYALFSLHNLIFEGPKTHVYDVRARLRR